MRWHATCDAYAGAVTSRHNVVTGAALCSSVSQEMAEWSEDACNMISSRLPSVIKKVVAASVAVSAKSCAKLLAYEGSVDKVRWMQ